MSRVLCLLVVLLAPCVYGTVTLPANQLFQNTLRKYNVKLLNNKDTSERWRRFIKAKELVDITTSNILLESLNKFTVMNDAEWKVQGEPLFGRSRVNITEMESYWASRNTDYSWRRRKRDLPATHMLWADYQTSVQDQGGCGSCWSFPNTATLESLQWYLTGHKVDMSEQFFVDCSFDFSGCTGGGANDGLRLTVWRQYIPSEADHPYTGLYEVCPLSADILSGDNNAMDDIWFQDWFPTSNTAAGLMAGLEYSPVSFGTYISNGFAAYSGGDFTDTLCSADRKPHAMLLVGYTETVFRVKASYGEDWGDGGYVSYLRDSPYFTACKMFDAAYYGIATYRREMQYEFCSDRKVVKRSDCMKHCKAKNTDSESGWTLAIFPTKKHAEEVRQMVIAEFPEKEGADDKFNWLWIGINSQSDPENRMWWIDNFTPANWQNSTTDQYAKKWGVMNKNDGTWLFKSSMTATHRGLCSRPVTCRDITFSLKHGDITFDREKLTEGTVATPDCELGFTLSGASTLTCVGGQWDQELPTCTGEGLCAKPTIAHGTVLPDTATIGNNEVYTVTCDTDYQIKGNIRLTCTLGELPALPTCMGEAVAIQCSAPTITDGTVNPTTNIDVGLSYTVTCNGGYEMEGSATIACSNDGGTGKLADSPTCKQACVKPTVDHGTIQPDSASIVDGKSYTVSCDANYVISGNSDVSCTNTQLSAVPTCEAIQCSAPTITGGTVNPTTNIDVGLSYTVTCNGGYEMEGSATIACSNDGGTGKLADSPTCKEIPKCSKPSITDVGTITPDSATIAIGESYTTTCPTNYFMTGEGEMTCSEDGDSAVLSDAPTCTEETCDGQLTTITDGKIKSGEGAKYTIDSTIVYECNDNFVLEGNTKIICRGTFWSSAPPTCKAINTNCASFTVDKGEIGNESPYFTADTVKVICNTDYILTGANPRVCTASNWEADAPTCAKNEGGQCIPLAAPAQGTLSCTGKSDGKSVGGTSCSVACNTDYLYLGSTTETRCEDETFRWGHQSSTNPLGDFGKCTEKKAPAAKKLKNKVTLTTTYCQNDNEKSLIETAVKDFLKDGLEIACLINSKCNVETVECDYQPATSDVLLTFLLQQTADMTDVAVLGAAKTKIKTAVKDEQFILSIGEDKKRRRKRAVTLSADSDSLETEDEVTCNSGEVEEEGVCVKCPSGYKTVEGACVKCPMGTYNGAAGAADCIACEGGKTTYGEGSTNADQCYTLCSVPEIYNGALNQPTGYTVKLEYSLTLTCGETYEPAGGEFTCGEYDSSTNKCSALTQCLSSEVALDINGQVTGDSAPFETGESVTFACTEGFKLAGSGRVVKCVERVWSSGPPSCPAVNSNCDQYTVENGKLDTDDSIFITNEKVDVTCNYGYKLSGTKPRVCGDTGWTTPAPTCTKIMGECVALIKPTNGKIDCTGNGVKDTCTVSCDSGYVSISDIKSVTCQDTLRWSHMSYDNSQGTFPPCGTQQPPTARKLEGQMYFGADLCRTDGEAGAVETAFETYITKTETGIPCLVDSECELSSSSCTNEDGSAVVEFVLTQTQTLTDRTVLKNADTKIKTLVEDGTFTFEVTTSKKRATSTLAAESGGYTGVTVLECGLGDANDGTECYVCPAGSKLTGTVCARCPVGSYSTGPSSASCRPCPGSTTTYGAGSSAASQCLDLCKIPGVTQGSLAPPTGYNVGPGTLVTLTCEAQFVGSVETFLCSESSSGTAAVSVTCSAVEEGETAADPEDGNSTTTVIVVVVVVVLLVLVAGGVAVFLLKKRGLTCTENVSRRSLGKDKDQESTAVVFDKNIIDSDTAHEATVMII